METPRMRKVSAVKKRPTGVLTPSGSTKNDIVNGMIISPASAEMFSFGVVSTFSVSSSSPRSSAVDSRPIDSILDSVRPDFSRVDSTLASSRPLSTPFFSRPLRMPKALTSLVSFRKLTVPMPLLHVLSSTLTTFFLAACTRSAPRANGAAPARFGAATRAPERLRALDSIARQVSRRTRARHLRRGLDERTRALGHAFRPP
mmetsp:Transcript_21155/g.65588  ORF Transcript_21155/g.65588 Transcript_21155/m.65588 type:complete len:202 (-) Transcript_21155:24-629(-)